MLIPPQDGDRVVASVNVSDSRGTLVTYPPISHPSPVGMSRVSETVWHETGTTTTPWKFTTYTRDTESNNDYAVARQYINRFGRFVTVDPSGLSAQDVTNPQSWNLYSYVQNNPIGLIDPTGLECVWDNGSYDSNDDSSTGDSAVDGSGNHVGCESQGGTWVDHSYFTSNGLADWSSQANADLAALIYPSATVNAGPWNLATFVMYGSMWAAGTLPTRIDYRPNDAATLAMINRPFLQSQLADYQEKGCPASYPANEDSVDAYIESLADANFGNPNYIQAEVGGYSGKITTSGGVTTVTITNVSGISSFVGYSAGVGEINKRLGTHFDRNAVDRTSGPGRNVTQKFTWNEKNPCDQ